MVNKQPNPLRLADLIDANLAGAGDAEISAELRRLHMLNAELLEALKGVIEVADFHELRGRRTDAARAAIAKAGGAA